MLIKNYKNILITGGTGSFGKAFLRQILKKSDDFERIIIFSRDELKQWELRQLYSNIKYPQLRFFLGDIRDKNRLETALERVDLVVHAAALKQVPAAEYNPTEFIKTNVIGSENIINASLKNNVQKIIALSTDKAAGPVNLYGATKLCADKLFVSANNISGYRNISFSVLRYGNVMGSRGSVIPYFLKKAKDGILPITHPEMTRFNISIEQGVEKAIWAIENSNPGEILVPKLPSYKIFDLAEAIGPSCEKQILGIRPGEKIHEEMITSSDSFNTIELKDNFVILPNSDYCSNSEAKQMYYKKGISFKEVDQGFKYDSCSNEKFLTIDEIRSLIRIHLKEDFKPY